MAVATKALSSDGMILDWLSAIRSHVEQIQKHGHSTSNPTPLLADGFDVISFEPVTWHFSDGRQAAVSNFASQQNWLRTLIALSVVTGDETYRQQADEHSRYFMSNYVHPKSGLFFWGGHRFVNLNTLQTEGFESKALMHELKHHLPLYDYLAQIDRQTTLNFIQSFWHAHVEDWQSLDLGRHGDYEKMPDPNVFKHLRNDVVDPSRWPELPETKGLTFVNAGTDLIFAAFTFARLTGDKNAAAWGKHLYRQYVLARNPDTGMPAYQFSSPLQRQPIPADDRQTESWYGDRAKRQFGPEFGEVAREANVLFRDMRPLLIDNPLAMLEILRQQPDEEMMGWVVSGLKSYYQSAYDVESNTLRPMWNDGQDMTGYRLLRDGYYGTKDTVLNAFPLEPDYLLPLVRAWNLTKDPDLLTLLSMMLKRFDLAYITCAEDIVSADTTDLASPQLLVALTELAESCDSDALFTLAAKVGNNLVHRHFHRGLFVESAQHRYVRLDDLVPLALLTYIGAIQQQGKLLPTLLTKGGYLHGDFQYYQQRKTIFDVEVIYTSLLSN